VPDDRFCIEVVLQFFEGAPIHGRPALAIGATFPLDRQAHYVEKEVLELLVGGPQVFTVLSDLEVKSDAFAEDMVELLGDADGVLAVRKEDFIAARQVDEDAASVHF
jgi:hypothetical protein